MIEQVSHTGNVARLSDDEVYRWMLDRKLGGPRVLGICGLNPSTADAHENDQTISKETGFALRWQCNWLWKVNAYGYRATKPTDMRLAAKRGVDIVGPENDASVRECLQAVVDSAGIFLVAWGGNIEPSRQAELAYLIDEYDVAPMCLGTNGDGTPKHPLYLPYSTPLVRWSCP